MITTLSSFHVVDAATVDHEHPFRISSLEFANRDDCTKWLWTHEEDLRLAIQNEVISGVEVQETKVPARFLVVGALGHYRKQMHSYLGWGARVLDETNHFFIVGIPSQYASWLAGRLASGLYYVGPAPSGASSFAGAKDEA